MNQPDNTIPEASLILTIFSTIVAIVSIKDVQIILGIVASMVAIISGIFAIRYYYLSSKEKSQILKKLDERSNS